MRAVVVASGPSAKGFVPPDGVTVFSVNGSIEWLSRADYWFTLDPSPANMQRMLNPRRWVEYHAAVPDDVSLPAHVMRWTRSVGDAEEPECKGSPDWWAWRWSARLGLPSEGINTGNSAWGATQLARAFGADKIALVGVDADSSSRVEGGTPNNLSHLPVLFNSIAGELDLVCCGKMVSNIPSLTIEEGMKWLTT